MSDGKTNDYVDKKRLVKDCIKIQKFSHNFILRINDNALIILKNFIIEKLTEISSENILQNHDEKIYEYCKYINNNYERLFQFYKDIENEEVPTDKKEILDEIKDILEIQNQQFLRLNDKSSINPIYKEKNNIIKGHVDNFINVYYENLSEYRKFIEISLEKRHYDDYFNNETANEAVYIHVLDNMIDKLLPIVFDEFLKIKIDCINDINDLDNRKITTMYFDLLKQEYGVISDIVKIKLLPEYLKLDEDAKDIEDDNVKIKEFFNIITETHEYMNENFHKISNFLIEIEELEEDLSYDNFEGEFILFYKDYFKLDNEEIKFFIKIFEEKLLNIQGRILTLSSELIKSKIDVVSKEAVEDISKSFDGTINMSNELMKTLKILNYYYKGNKKKLNESKDADIITGIDETILIKIESMKENLDSFIGNKMIMTEKILYREVDMSERYEKKLLQDFFEIWNLNYSSLEKELNVFIEKNETILNNADKNIKDIENEKDKIKKYVSQYEKNNLFFEIITLEEIGNYSISKLRENQGNIEQDYVTIFDKVISQIDEVLEAFGIKRITPTELQDFDVKQHEILLAEDREDMKKGQIIKIVNNGFYDEESVIIRANVIVAK